jgi:hypothetical protein
MRLNVVRLLKLSLAILFAFFPVSVSSLAQSTQPAQPTQPSAQGQQSQPQTPPAAESVPASSPATAPQPGSEQGQSPGRIKVVPAKPQQKAPQNPDDRLLIKDAFKVSPEVLQRALRERVEGMRRQQLVAGNPPEPNDPAGSLDRGIYARQVDGANVCGAIVSYNFSVGADPQLESVTTCTPSNAVVSKRAGVPRGKPAGPQLLQTVYQQEQEK